MDIPVDLLVTSTTDDLVHSARHRKHHRRSTDGGGELDDKELNQLAAHLPDLILNQNLSATPPFVRQLSGVIMFLDISGFTDLSEKCSANGVAGSDQLTAILNDYMGAMIEEVLRIKGDVLKFAGDAILAFWKINDYDHLLRLVKSVIECSCNIQSKYGTYNAEGLTTLRVKIALSLGKMYFFVFGNHNRYFFCESGAAVKDAKDAEALSKSGDIIVSPYMWSYCVEKDYSYTMLEDGKHAKITGIVKQEQLDKTSLQLGGSGDMPRGYDYTGEEAAVTSKGEVYRKAAFETGIHLNETLSKYVTDIVLDKLEAGQGVEYHSEIRPCTIAFINLLLVSDDLKASMQCDILQKAYEVIDVELEIYKASLNKVVMFDKGCSFLIIFGLPGKKDSYDCKHAVQCAYKIREKLAELHEVKVSSAGVTTGHTFCGVVGHEYRHEYTVIGKMVNMAARLMTYYPGMVSCDNETYSHSRLRQHHFRDVPVKELKGLTDVGVIREYTEDSTHISFLATPLSRSKKPMVAREKEIELYNETVHSLITAKHNVEKTASSLKEIAKDDSQAIEGTTSTTSNIATDLDSAPKKNLLLYEGALDSGTTRLLSEIATIAGKTKDLMATDFTMTSNDLYRSCLGIRTILASLLKLPYEDGKAKERLKVLRSLLLLEYDREEVNGIIKCLEDMLILANHIEESRAEPLTSVDDEDSEVVLQVLESVFNLVMEQQKKFYVLIIDEAEHMDGMSWKFIQLLGGRSDVLVVMSMMNYEKSTPVDYIDEFLELPTLHRCRVESLPPDVLAIVACQMINVSAIPVELEQLLMEKTQGNPGYIRHIITDLLASHQLQIVSLLQYQTDYDDYVWPDFELIAGHPTVVTRKRSMLRTKNKWAFHSQLPETRDPAEDRICIISPRSQFSAATYKTPSSLKGQLLIEIDQLTPSEQLVLKCASVIGVVCSIQILHILWPFPTATLNTALETLFSKDFLRCYAATKKLSGREMHNNCICDDSICVSMCRIITFTNHLMRDTVYSILVEDLRCEMHYKVAKYLENSVSHLSNETVEELTCQELPFLADDISYIFADCKSLKLPEERTDLALPANKPNLYTYVRLSSCVSYYVSSQEGGFCSQKLLDWLMEQETANQSMKHRSSSKSGGTDDILNKANGELYHNKGKKKRSRSFSRSVRSRALKLKNMLTKQKRVSDERNNSTASIGNVHLGSSSRRSRAGSIRQGRKKTKTQSMSTTIPGGRRRNASVDSSFSEGNRSSGKFSIALTQALGEQEQKMDLLASRRESLTAVDSVKRPIIGKADVDTESKFNLFRQTLWHWRSSLHLKNTLFTLVEAGCVALQHRFLQQAYIYLKFAHLIATKIKQKINPLTGEPLTDQTELLEGFWVSHSTKLVTLIALVHCCVGEYAEASALYSASLEELQVNIPDGLFGISAKRLKKGIGKLLDFSRRCLPETLKKQIRPTDASAQLEVSRILSSLYHSQGTSKGSAVVQLLLDTSLGISQHTQDEFEVLICYGNIIHHYQQEAKFSALHRIVNKTNVFERELNLNEVDKAKKGLIRLAQLYLNLVKLHSSLCEGDSSGVSESVKKIDGIVKEVPDKDGLNNLYFVPTLHQAALRELCYRPEDLGAAILSLQTVDDATYFTCLWEEFIAAGFVGNELVTADLKEEMMSYTQETLDYRLENIPDHEVTPLDTDVYEHNILASYVLYMLVKKEFSSPLEMQNSIVLMEALQPKELNTYWKVHVYAKVAMAAVLALEQTKNADSLRVLAAKMLNNLNSSCKSVPVFLTVYKKLQRALASWQKEGIILKDFIHIASVYKH